MVQVERSAGSQELHIRQANNMFIYYLGSGQGHSVAVTCSIAGTFCVRRCFYYLCWCFEPLLIKELYGNYVSSFL